MAAAVIVIITVMITMMMPITILIVIIIGGTLMVDSHGMASSPLRRDNQGTKNTGEQRSTEQAIAGKRTQLVKSTIE